MQDGREIRNCKDLEIKLGDLGIKLRFDKVRTSHPDKSNAHSYMNHSRKDLEEVNHILSIISK